ncbi:MAG: hypothetical protein KIS30_09820 [Thermoplasmata archaeon]|nr:hypothetical protein [Candidatus Sysuiplasma acidicola]MBX8647032.1 hypothetical protein [Candidatus Sysuiplasma acidicola]
MFSPDKQLREIIVEELRSEPVSISGLVRKLRSKGIIMHRLVLTGYLRALTDLGIVRERPIPPSKIFVPVSGRDPTIYEAISNACEENRLDGRTSTAVAVYTLERLFHRPVFRRELQEMKLAETPELKLAPATVIAEARRILSKAGYRLPDNEPAYLVEGSYENEFRAILVALVSTGFRLSHLSLDTKQLTL